MVKESIPLNRVIIFRKTNPKRKGTKSYDRFEKYKKARSYEEALQLGMTAKDYEWDHERRFVMTAKDYAKVMKKIKKRTLTMDIPLPFKIGRAHV